MRKLIIKLFFGPVLIKKRFVDRIAFFNFALMIKLITLNLLGYTILSYITAGFTLLFFLMFTFRMIDALHYWNRYPVHWDELTAIQRYYYGTAYEKMPYLKKPKDLEDNWRNFQKIKIFFIAKLQN